MKLRDYQQKAVDAVLRAWQSNRSCLIVLPTGCGKTVVFGEVIRRRLESVGRAMILAHREELISQAEQKVAAITSATVDVEMGPREVLPMFGKLPKVVVSSVQTQITGRMNKFDPADFTTLVIDEAHHATAKSYRSCIEHYFKNPACRLLGVTATPDRADEAALGTVFDAVAYEYSVDQAIRDGWLVPVRQKMVSVGSLDYSQVSTTCGDFNQSELGEILEEESNLHGIASPTIEICGKRRAIIFATTVKQAERLAEIINRHFVNATTDNGTPSTSQPLNPSTSQPLNLPRAEWICGSTPKEARRVILKDFKEGRIQFIVNVGVLTEGFDDAGVEVVVMARPTKSRALYAQMAGRATRPAAEIAAKLGEIEVEKRGGGGQRNSDSNHLCPPPPSTSTSSTPADLRRKLIASSSKPGCLIVDFVGNSGRHKLVTAVDILGGRELDPDEEAAKAMVRKLCEEADDDGLDTQEELEKAREKVRKLRIEEAKRREFIRLKAKYRVTTVDPFNVYDLPPVPQSVRCQLDRRSITPKQRRVLIEKIGVNPDRMPYSESKSLIDAYFGRMVRGLATLRQTKFLRRHGINVPMTKLEASATISLILDGRNRV